eukprot:c27562_g2_i2 orf=166-3330(+)
MECSRGISMLLVFLAQSFQVALLVLAEGLEGGILQIDDWSNLGLIKMHSENVCAMYGICGEREDGKSLNCPNPTLSVKPDALFSAKIQSLCPEITGDVCCTAEQFDVLRNQVQQAVPFLVGCPACLRNFLNLFCELSCSPNQSLFINVTSVTKGVNSSTVKAVDFYVTEGYGEMLYSSCKDVTFGAMNTRAMDFVGGGAKSAEEWLSFLGMEAELYEPGSPFAIRFISSLPKAGAMRPLNVPVVPCWDSSLSCSCGDCPSASVCSEISPSVANSTSHCSVHIGSIEIKCVDLALTILYILVISAIFFSMHAWKRGQGQSIDEPLLCSMEDNNASSLHDEVEATLTEVIGNDSIEKPRAMQHVIQGFLSEFFRSQGTWVARNPGRVLLVSAFIVFLLCLGLFRLNVQTDPQKLWVSPGSRAAAEKEFFDTHLAPFYRIEQLILATIPPAGMKTAPSIVTDENILLLFEMQKKINALNGNNSGSLISLDDVCMKPFGSACATQSVLQYFKMDLQLFEDYGGSSHTFFCFEHYSSSAPCLSAYEAPVDPSTVLGGFTGSNFSEATAFVVTYPVRNSADENGEENAAAVAWEEAFVVLAKEELIEMAVSHNLTIAFSSENSIQAELKRESTADIVTIVISYVVMFAYISISLGDFSPSVAPVYVTSKALLGLAGVAIVAFSVLGSVGLFSAFGVKSTLIIAEVIPFLVLAVGVDNMCIIVHAVKRQDIFLPPEVRIGNALAEVGPSITLASLAETLAFAVGTVTPMPACRVFSIFAAFAVFLDYLLQVTAFIAFLTYDLIRAQENRVDCFPCIIQSSSSNEYLEVNGALQQKNHELGALSRYMQRFHAPFLQMKVVKAIVLAVFAGFVLMGIALTARVSVGLDQKVVLPRDSYLQGYFDNLTEYLRIGPPVYFVVQDYNYSLSSNQTNLLCSISQCNPNSLLNQLSKAAKNPERSFIAKPAASWLDDFLVWISPDAFGCCRKFPSGQYCPPDDQPPCCVEGDYCGITETCKNCTTCFLHSDLQDGRPSTEQFREKLPWFLNALPSSDCSKGGIGAYSN